jgi:hypothetical protein
MKQSGRATRQKSLQWLQLPHLIFGDSFPS